jgi:isopenicillin-N epimerase
VSLPSKADYLLDPDIHFLNHGSFGACPEPVLEVQRAWRDELEREPVRFFVTRAEAALEEARETLARFVGASPEDLAFVSNATTGVNAVLQSLALGADDELLTTDHVYNACRNALAFVAARTGATVTTARVPFPLAGEDEVVQAVLDAVTSRTRLLLIDHVTSPTGLVFPVERLVREMEARGVDTLVDGAHGPGMLALDLDDLGAAYYTGNLHKWVCAPKGAAFLHVRKDRQERVHPTVISHGANSPRRDRSRFRLEFDWTGTDDPTPWLAVPAALEFLGGLFPGGWKGLRRHNRELCLEGRRRLAARLGVNLPCPEEMIGTLGALALPDGPKDLPPRRPGAYETPLQTALVEQYGIQVPIVTWPQAPKRWVRISAQAYNEPAEYDRLAEALAELLGS